MESDSLMSGAVVKVSPHAWFALEIQQMMHGFGDVRKPLHETAVLIEEITHQHIQSAVLKVADVAAMRNARSISLEDFLFLLRKDKVKLRRLIRYMSLKDLKMTKTEDEDSEATGVELKGHPRKRKKICQDFLSTIDHTGELSSLCDDDSIDDIKHERALRAELQTRSMDSQQYKEFCEARQTSFSRKYRSQKFKDWVLTGLNLDVKPNVAAMEVFSYLTYETVAQIIDLSLIVRRDSEKEMNNPISAAISHCISNHDAMDSQNLSSISAALTAAAAAAATSHVKKEPVTPTSPTTDCAETITQTSANFKSKFKKRKKIEGSSRPLELGSIALQPADVWEAVRRYSQFIDLFSSFSKHSTSSPRNIVLSM
ncbi:transcription initiation protein SPT3 homolog isoform X1 [Tubulanus polymorphus]|uniref:transcription initiation protein SPT3 homolog isoform X1 n=1 Tax=Tubulanus polymorphus TaxID=672921 RepID=UPI003DA210CD